MKTKNIDKASKAERDLEALLADMKKVRRELSRMIRSVSAGSRHAVKDIKSSTSLKVSRTEITNEDVIEALASFSITRGDSGWNVYPPKDKIHPTTWNRIRFVLSNNGGDWSTQRQAFVFERDPRPIFSDLTKGKLRNVKKDLQAFFTPNPIARQVVKLADVRGKTVLEPSAGQGALANACEWASASLVVCYEIDKDNYDKLRAQGFSAAHCSFFDQAPGLTSYDRVVMNPPFAKNAYVKHILHALGFLNEGGRLVSIIPGTEMPEALKSKLPKWSTWELTPLPRHAFRESGTDIQCSILVINLDQGPAKK